MWIMLLDQVITLIGPWVITSKGQLKGFKQGVNSHHKAYTKKKGLRI